MCLKVYWVIFFITCQILNFSIIKLEHTPGPLQVFPGLFQDMCECFCVSWVDQMEVITTAARTVIAVTSCLHGLPDVCDSLKNCTHWILFKSIMWSRVFVSELLLELDRAKDSDGVSLLQHQHVDSLPVRIQTEPRIHRTGLQASNTNTHFMTFTFQYMHTDKTNTHQIKKLHVQIHQRVIRELKCQNLQGGRDFFIFVRKFFRSRTCSVWCVSVRLCAGTTSGLPASSCPSAAAPSSATGRWRWRAAARVSGVQTVSVSPQTCLRH